jgi:hypothetical protein
MAAAPRRGTAVKSPSSAMLTALPKEVTEASALPDDGSAVAMIDDSMSTAEILISTKVKQVKEKFTLEIGGPYTVCKLVTTGKMPHVSIEQSLNEHAADGWFLEQILVVGADTFAIFHRDESKVPKPEPAQA